MKFIKFLMSFSTKSGRNRQIALKKGHEKNTEFVDLVKRFPTSYSNEYLIAAIGVDTAENGLLKVWARKLASR